MGKWIRGSLLTIWLAPTVWFIDLDSFFYIVSNPAHLISSGGIPKLSPHYVCCYPWGIPKLNLIALQNSIMKLLLLFTIGAWAKLPPNKKTSKSVMGIFVDFFFFFLLLSFIWLFDSLAHLCVIKLICSIYKVWVLKYHQISLIQIAFFPNRGLEIRLWQ